MASDKGKAAAPITPDMDLNGLTDVNDIREYREACRLEITTMLESVASEGNREFNADESNRIDMLNERFEQSDRLVERREMANKVAARDYHERHGNGHVRDMQRRQHEEISRRPERRIVGNGELDSALRTWFRVQNGHQPTEGEVRSAARVDLNLMARSIDLRMTPGVWTTGRDRLKELERRDAGEQTIEDTWGEELVAQDFMRELERAMLFFGGMRQACRVIRTGTGSDLPWPVVNDTGNGAAIVGEASSLSATDMNFDQVTLKAWKYATRVDISSELMNDNAVNLVGILGGMLGERLGRGTNTAYTVGATGTANPAGAFDGTVGFRVDTTKDWTAGAPTIGQITQAMHAVDVAYRRGPGAAWMMNDATAALVRSANVTTGGVVWVDSLQAGQPQQLMGLPVVINNDVPDGAGAAEIIAGVGDWSHYAIRDAGTIRIARSEHFRFAEDVVSWAAYLRTDGRPLNKPSNGVTDVPAFDPVVLIQEAS